MTDFVYLDNNATTQPLPEVVAVMAEHLRSGYANPSSAHRFGQQARHQIEQARSHVANLIGAAPSEIVFTSGGTESINLAIRSVVTRQPSRRRIVTSAVEHSAVLAVVGRLEEDGYEVLRLGVDRRGLLDEAEVADALTEDTALFTLIHVNNETGVVWDIPKLAALAAQRGVPVHVDAVQSVGRQPISITEWPVQLASFSAHKFHGPAGVGALYVRSGTRLAPLIVGGGQERGLRGGTENSAGIVGMGEAARQSGLDMPARVERIKAMRDELERRLLQAVPDACVCGDALHRAANTCNIGFTGVDGEALLVLLSQAGICVSSGAACSSGSMMPSHVLQAMGLEPELINGAVRFSLSGFTTAEEIDRVADVVPRMVERCRGLSKAS